MPPLQAYWHPMFYLLWIYRGCSNTLLTPYLQPCIYQYHQWTPYIFISTYAHMSWLKTNSFYYWLTFSYRIEPTRLQYIKFLPWISHMETTQPVTTSTQDTLESPRMPRWDWNYPTHNLRYANRQMDSSATSLHLSNLWLILQHALLPSMPRVKLALNQNAPDRYTKQQPPLFLHRSLQMSGYLPPQHQLLQTP